MAAWTPPKEDEVVEPISETEPQTWKPPETDVVQEEWTPPREDDPDDPINIKDPWKISQLKESGQTVSDEQERILFDYEDEKPLTQKTGEFIGGALKTAPGAFADIAVGGAELGYKGVLLPLNEMFLGFAMYTPEQRAKILRDRDLTYKALASGGAQGLDEAMKAGTRLTMLGSSVTDKLQGLPKEERFRRYMTRESMRKISQAARDETPDTLARLTAESPLIRGIVKTMVDMEGGDPKAQEEAVKEYERLVKESGMTKEELDEFAKVVNFGDVSMPTALPGANTLTKVVSKPIVTATQKGGELALKGLNLGSRATGWTAGKVIGAGEYIQKKARDIGEYAVNDPDTFLKGAVNTVMLPVMTVVKPTKTVADVITDITRQVDVGGAAGRRGMFERAGRDVRSTATTQKLFGPEGKGGVGRAKLADWAVRQSNAMIQPGVNAGALNVLMGLPDAETAEQAGEQFGTGFGIGAYSGTRAESRVLGLVDPRTTLAQKVTNLVTPDPTQLRRDQDADIKRFMATTSPELRQQMQDLASIDKRKTALDQAIAETTDVQSRTIDKETSEFLQMQIDGFQKQKAALEKATPETQREYDRLIQLTTLDALDQAQAVGTAAGLRGMNLVFLDPANAESFYRNLYGQTLIEAEKSKAILTGKALTPDEQNTLREANETLAAFAQRVDNAQNTRGFAIAEPITDANDPEYVPPHLRMQNQQGATAVISMDLVKHLTNRGFNVRHAIQHEVQHALENFKEVQDLLSPVRKYLFDQKVQNDDGTFTVVSEGAYNDQKLDEYAIQYAQKFSPADGGAGFFAQFGGDIQKQRDYIKREILAEVATAGGEYEGGSRAALDDVGRNFVDWLEVTTRDGFLKKMKEGLRKVGVVVDNTGGYTTLFDAKITPEVVATIRQYQRGLRDMNGALTYNAKREVEEPDIPLVKILGNRALQEKYKNADFFEKEQIVRATQPDGSQTEIVVPEGANLDSFTGIYRVENGQLVDEDGTPMQLAPEINVQAMPNGTKFEVDTRIARKPDGSPIIIQNREMKRRAIDRTQMLVNAIESAPKDDSPFRMIDVGKGDYRGAMSPSQVEALLKIPNTVLSPNLKRMIQFFNEILRRGDGTRVLMEYQAALLNGKYKAIAPRLRDEVPIGFKITKDGNFTVTTMSVSRMYDKMNAWVAKKPMRLQAWGGDTGKFWDSVMKVLENHAKGERGETGLHPDPYIALRMKNVVNDLFNVYNAETKAANPERTTLPREKGKDPVDVVVRSRRLDRINNFSEIGAQKLPMNYGKLLENYLPANNPLARPQSPDEMMMNLDGSVTATRIRNAIASGNVEQLESELRASDDLLPFESLYVSQGETGEPQIQVVSMLEPGIEPSLEPSEIPRDIDAETEAEIARLDAEQDMAEQAQLVQQGQQGQQVPQVRAEFISPAADELSQAVKEYQSGFYNSEIGGYANLQSVLRYGKPKYEQYWNDEKGKEYINALNSLFEKSRLPQQQTVYRGVVLPVGKRDEIFQLKEGDIISDRGITSASTDAEKVANKFQTKLNRNDRLVYYTINLDSGTKAINVGEITGENIESEIAIAPNTKFKVVSNEYKNGATFIELETISNITATGDISYLPAEKIGKKVSEEYGLEEGQEAETRLTPRTLYNLYYIATEPEPSSEYGREIQNEYIDKYKRLYVDVFSNLVRQQIEKYIKRGRVDSNITQANLDKADNPSLLDELMRGTYRSDMRRRNDVWNIVTDHLKNLASAKTKKDKIFYMDRLNNSIHNTQELLFSKFNNYGQLQEAFDAISNARDTRAFSQRVDKDLREAGSFTADTQYLPYVPYSLPRDPRKIMADFYLLTTTGDKAGYFGKNWEKIKGVIPPTRAGLRYEEYGENLEEAVGKLTEQMKRHMSDSLLFSISAELRHALERSQPDELMNNPFMKAYREYYESYEKLKNVNLTPLIEKNLQGIYPEGKRARITKGSAKEYQASNKAVRKALEETGTSLQDFSEIAENIFRKGRWATSYGGQPWGNIAEGLRMIVNAETTGDMVKAMDNAYDLQHNTATVFNKIKKYQREGGYKWLQDMLDFKYHAMTPRELVPLASSAAKRIAAPALLDIGDPALDKSRENAVSASSEELVSGLESAIGRLKGNQENVYNDIWVKAQKGSGKDINEELFKWLRAQMPARKDELEAVGVNQDIIRYARLLLAEKMAPLTEVPSDITEMVARSVREQKLRENQALTFLSPEDKNAMMSIALKNLPDSDPQYQKVMQGIYENYTSEQVKYIFEWYLKYKYKVGGLLAENKSGKPKAQKQTQETGDAGIFPEPLPDTTDWMLPDEKEHVIKEATKAAELGKSTDDFFNSLKIHGKKVKEIFSDKQATDLVMWYIDLLKKYEAEAKAVNSAKLKEAFNFKPFVDPAKAKQTEKTTSETSQKTLNLKPFDETDWDAFSGATEFSEGKNNDEKQPLISEVEMIVNGEKMEVLLIADQYGFQVSYGEENKESNEVGVQSELTNQKYAKEYLQEIFDSGELHEFLTFNAKNGDVFTPVVTQKQPEAKQTEKMPDIEEFWPKALSFMSLPEIKYVKHSIKYAIKTGKNSNDWLGELEIYGNKASIAYSPDSQKELKKLFEEEAKKLQKSANPRLSLKKAEDYFNKAITDYGNSYWNQIINPEKNYTDELGLLTDSLFRQYSKKPEFSAKKKTISIGRRTYTGYTPVKGGDIYILYGSYSNPSDDFDNLNYKWDGAATFKTKNKTKDEVLDELEEWFKGEIDYNDPQI